MQSVYLQSVYFTKNSSQALVIQNRGYLFRNTYSFILLPSEVILLSTSACMEANPLGI